MEQIYSFIDSSQDFRGNSDEVIAFQNTVSYMDASKQPHHHTHDLKQTLPFDYIHSFLGAA